MKNNAKLWAVVIGSSALLAVIVILVTCTLFDYGSEIDAVNWKNVVSNSTWILSENNTTGDNLAVCLKNATSVFISDDYCLTVNYGQYSFGCGELGFNNEYNSASIVLSQGAVENNLTLNFSNQEEKFYLTIAVDGSGNLYFFK